MTAPTGFPHGTDGGNNDGYSPVLTVDVVPYITDIITGFEIGLKSQVKRSALGRYTVAAGSTVTIKGYNLAGTAAGSVDVGGDEPVILSGDATQQVIVLGSISGGDVTVTTNGISSRNNTNANTLPQNQEAAAYYPDRNDDRVIALWQLTNTGWAVEDAVMRPVIDTATGNRTGMEWMYVTTNDTLWLGGDKMTTSFTLSGGDFGYNSSGTRLWSFLHDAKWWITETNDSNQQYFGSVQWSMQNGYTYTAERDEAYNWNIAAQTGRLGLGNMVYQSGTTGQIDRYENIQMKLVGNNSVTANYVTYYDKNSLERGITFVSFQTGTGVASSQYDLGNYGGADWYSTIERVNPYDKAYAPTGNEGQKGTGINNPEYAGTATMARHKVVAGADAGADYVMAVDAAGTVYLAWYDPDTDATGGDGFDGAGIKFMYNTDPVASPLAGWTDPVTVTSNAADTAYSHLALAVDPDGGIHLAYQDDDKGFLYYTYAASRTDVGTVMNTLLLDALFSSGQHNSLVIKDFDITGGTDYRPVITTFSSAFTGTRQSLRVLYPAGAAGTVSMAAVAAGADLYGDFSGAWESIAVPASTAPKSVGTFTETDGAAAGEGRIMAGYNGLYMEEAVLLDLP